MDTVINFGTHFDASIELTHCEFQQSCPLFADVQQVSIYLHS